MKSNQIKTTAKRTPRAAEIVFPWDLRWANQLVIQYGMVCPENIHTSKIITNIVRCFLGRVYVRLWCTFRCIYISLITRKWEVVRKTRHHHLSHQDLSIALRSRLSSISSTECSLCDMCRMVPVSLGCSVVGLPLHALVVWKQKCCNPATWLLS